jgi:hypothetical protein
MCGFCNVWLCVCVGVVMCVCCDNCVGVLVICVLYCLYRVFVLFCLCIFLFVTSVRTAATE